MNLVLKFNHKGHNELIICLGVRYTFYDHLKKNPGTSKTLYPDAKLL